MNIATLVILAVLAFWMLGAHKRLKRLRAKTHHSYGPLASHLRQRHAVALALAEAARPLLPGDLQPVAAQLIDAARQASRATDEAQARGMRGNTLQVVGSAEQSLGVLLDRLVGELQDLTSGTGPEPAITELLRQRDALQEQIHISRLVYNREAERYNHALHVFPTTLVALAWRFKEAPLLSGQTALRVKGQPSSPMPLL
ncbi:LemA family protein [Sphaerotilus sp.]|uniref:LemA family protein n=1 Tax=Sphaerotilus sp. TaxID=2093942 RepID=UPI002ACD3104|nr:LemA family protein [Sphaerotilus sp.]MDZ7855041.1 LemA family protein [Sphaerotilus sp.]